MLAEVFELGQRLHSEALSTARVLAQLVEVDLLDVHRVVLLQHGLRPLDQARHCPGQGD